MMPIVCLAILSTALVASERVRFSRASSLAKPDAGPVAPEQAPSREHYWSKRAGNLLSNSDVPWTAPSHLSQGPSWNWSNPLGEQVRHSPLIDDNSDIYIATSTRIRKFSKQGALLWTADSLAAVDGDSEMVTCPVLYGDAILAVLQSQKASKVIIYSLSLATGAMNWRRERAALMQPDANAALAHNGTLIFATADEDRVTNPSGANKKVVAVSTIDGKDLWDYSLEGVVWNFVPASPGDGTLLFATSCGVPYRLDFSGRLLWKGAGFEPGRMCSAGGGALSPDGSVFFTSFTVGQLEPGTRFQALRVEDGSVLWTKTVYYGSLPSTAQYPAVGRLGSDGPLAVVGGVGDQPLMSGMDPRDGHRELVNAVVALDAETGEQLWLSEEAPWPHSTAAGDEQSAVDWRKTPRNSATCFPDGQGIPVITGDGTVYASSSHSGDLRAIQHKGPEGAVKASEVSTFHPRAAFLNSPSVAPGMLVAAPCWGPTYVWLANEAKADEPKK